MIGDDKNEIFGDLIPGDAYLDRATFTQMVEDRVGKFLTDEPDLLFSYLYRLDVDERKIQEALNNGSGVAHALAVLIVDRQIERIKTKQEYKNSSENWNWEI
ncbi:MAG: hypothetical protein ABI844_04085 [Saprospiraceae bacterium]